MADVATILSEGGNVYQIVADYLGISLLTAIVLLSLISLWGLVWKGIALWKASKNKQIAWFIAALLINAAGFFAIPYIFICSKIKDDKVFKKLHDACVFLIVILAVLSFWKIAFFVPLFLIIALFSVSMIQESVNRKERGWLVFNIILMPLIPIIYYFVKIRKGGKRK